LIFFGGSKGKFFFVSLLGEWAASEQLTDCSFGLSATSQQYFSLRTNQPPAISQQYFSLRTNQHQPTATSQTNRLLICYIHVRVALALPRFSNEGSLISDVFQNMSKHNIGRNFPM
jgi:hypothetical protein